MILLSNPKSHSTAETRLIKVKPVEFFRKENQDQEEPEQEKINIEQKIMTAKQELDGLREEKEALIQATNEQIAKEKSNWEAEKEEWIRQAQEEGYQEGLTIGQREGLKQYKHQLEQANSIIESASQDYHSIIEKNEETILELAIHTAEKIIQQKITMEPTSFIQIVQAAIKDIKDQSKVSIYLHPNNYPVVLEQKNELQRILENDAQLSIYINNELAENACLIEHPFGQVDAGVDTQLLQIREILQDISMETKS